MTRIVCLSTSKVLASPGAKQHARRLAASIALAACMGVPWAAHAAPADLAHDVPPGAATCAACHGAQGEGSSTGVPRLAGQNTEYLAHALTMFKAGTRANPIMQPIAGSLNDADIPKLAAYFANLHGPLVPAAAPQPELVAAGKQLALVGATATGTAACFSCHGAGGVGVGARYPSLAGQPATFVVDRLHEFQARAKGKTPAPASMTAVAAQLDETQIRQAAAYLSTLAPASLHAGS